MDAEQRGWYIQLLAEAWESEPQATLPNDDPLLRVLAGVNTSSTDVEHRWILVRSQFKKRGSVVYNERQMEEVVKQEVNRQKKSEAGKASAEARRAEREAIKAQHLRKNERGSKRSTPVETVLPVRANITPTESNSSIPIPISSPSSTSVDKTKDMSLADARTVFDFWRSYLNHPNARLDNKRERCIRNRLKEGFSVEDLERAIRGCKASSYHMGQNDSHTVYDRIDLIFRDTEHVELFIAKAPPVNGNGTAKTVESPEAKAIRESCTRCFGTGTERTDKGARVCKHD
jgi:uncharacterized protein YdaU (DUF1376 family)